MQTRVGMWGGSCAIRLPKMAVETLGLHEGNTVTLRIEAGALVVRPARRAYSLAELAAEARMLTPPEPLDDPAMGDEAL